MVKSAFYGYLFGGFADGIVSPILNHEVAQTCNRRKILWAPGCGTLSEISQAEEWGAEIVKLFPAAQSGGPGFVKAIAAPCLWTAIMPTGGVEPTEESLKSWFGTGSYCVGMGAKLLNPKWIAEGDFTRLADLIKDTMALTAKIRA